MSPPVVVLISIGALFIAIALIIHFHEKRIAEIHSAIEHPEPKPDPKPKVRTISPTIKPK